MSEKRIEGREKEEAGRKKKIGKRAGVD